MQKRTISILAIIGTTLGGWVPTWFGAGAFSFWSLLLAAVGGFAGIWLGWRLTQ